MPLRVLRPVALLLLLLSLRIAAQELRDPTLPPSEMGAGLGAKANAEPLGAQGMAVIVRDAKSFLVVGTRLYAAGQKVGPARIERITETAVWLREGKVLRKVPRFAGIQRSAAVPVPSCDPGAPKSSKSVKPSKTTQVTPKAKVVSCDGAQP
ncbi:MAG: hypothetical protein Q8R67_02045 [Rhodoferax sp.]|nr:hypothetical protein [Rhodoferax sp.]MDP3650442.1 hypothetical protein [Rhodoferax sp.]